jgi:hypothetical protein
LFGSSRYFGGNFAARCLKVNTPLSGNYQIGLTQ